MTAQKEIHGLLNRLPRKLCVSFASHCAEDVFEYVKAEDKAVVRACLDTTTRWLEGKATAEEVQASATSAASASSAAYYASYYSASASASAASVAYAASASASAYAAYAASAAYYAASAKEKASDKHLSYLKQIIKDLPRVDRLIYGLY